MRWLFRAVFRWSLLVLPLVALGIGLNHWLSPEPRWMVSERLQVLAVRPEGVLLHGTDREERIPASLVVRDLATGQVRHSFFPPGDEIKQVQLSEAGPWIAAWCTNDVAVTGLYLGNVLDGQERALPLVASTADSDLLFSPTDPIVAVSCSAGLELRDSRNGQLLKSLLPAECLAGRENQAWAFTADGERLLVTCWDAANGCHHVKCWDLKNHCWAYELADTVGIGDLESIISEIGSLSYVHRLLLSRNLQTSKDGRWLVGRRSAPGNNLTRWVIWNLHDRRVLAEGESTHSVGAEISADSGACVFFDPKQLRAEVWDLVEARRRSTFVVEKFPPKEQHTLEYLKLSPNGHYLLTYHVAGAGPTPATAQLRVYDTTSGRLLWTRDYDRWKASAQQPYLPDFVRDGAMLIMPVDPAALAGAMRVRPRAVPGECFRLGYVACQNGTEQAHIPLVSGWGSGYPWSRSRLAPDGQYYIVHERGICAPDSGSFLEAFRNWMPWNADPWAKSGSLLSVIDVDSRTELFRAPGDLDVDAWLAPDGHTLITRTHVIDETPGDPLPTLMAWDVPTRKPLRWVFGLPLALAALAISLRRWWRNWPRRKTSAATIQRRNAPC